MEAPPIERRLVAILSADVEGYSLHGDKEATMATLSAHRAVVDGLICRHRGRIANMAGDSVLAEFASVLDAVRCAIEIQEALERANEVQPEGRQMRFRIGVSVEMSWSRRVTSSEMESMSPLDWKAWSRAERFACRAASAIICVIAVVCSLRI